MFTRQLAAHADRCPREKRSETSEMDSELNPRKKTPHGRQIAVSRSQTRSHAAQDAHDRQVSPFGLKLAPILRAFRHRNYRLFFGGQFISLTGTWMQTVAQAWLVYRLTGSAVLLGFVAFAGQFPVFLFAPLGGAVADRQRRHRILVITQTASMLLAFCLAALTLTHQVQVWHVFALAALLGLVNAFDVPTRQAFVVDMVGRDDLINAIALNSSMFNGARIVGPAVAGMLVATVGEGWCFFANGISYIAVIAGLLLMKLTRHGARPAARIDPCQRYRGTRLRRTHGTCARAVVAARVGQPPRDAVCRAHADLRRPDTAWRRAGAWGADGRIRHRRPHRRLEPGCPARACEVWVA